MLIGYANFKDLLIAWCVWIGKTEVVKDCGGFNEVLVDIFDYFSNGGADDYVRLVVEKKPKSKYAHTVYSFVRITYF